MAQIYEYETKNGDKRYQVYWDLPMHMLKPGGPKKGSLTVKTIPERDTVKQMAELASHAITGPQISAFLKQALMPQETTVNAEDQGMTLIEWQEEFLKSKKGQWNGKHGHDQTRKIRDIIVPVLGPNRPLDSIEGGEIDQLCWALREGTLKQEQTHLDYKLEPLAFTTVDNYWDLMRQLFSLAHRRGLVPKDPMAFVNWTKGMTSDDEREINKNSDRYFETEEFETFLSQIRPDYQLFVELLVETGLRFSEASALKVRDFDTRYRMISVRQAWKGYYPGGGGELGPTKNRQHRYIGLTDEMFERVAARVVSLPNQKDAKDHEDKLIFVGTRNGIILNSNFRRDHWNPAMIRLQQCPEHLPMRIDGRNGLSVVDPKKTSDCSCLGSRPWTKYTPHSLRHTFATWLIDEGENIEWVSQLLGHSSTKVTEDVYVHQIRRSKQYHRTARALDRKRGRAVLEALHRAA